jgi:hypothetical protein
MYDDEVNSRHNKSIAYSGPSMPEAHVAELVRIRLLRNGGNLSKITIDRLLSSLEGKIKLRKHLEQEDNAHGRL